MKKICLLFLIAVLTASLIPGCGNSAPGKSGSSDESGTPTENAQDGGAMTEEDAAYAGPMVDNILTGIADKDYAVFSRDFSDVMKSAMTKDAFDQLVGILESKIGQYQSRAFGQAVNVTQNGIVYTVVIYTAKYSDEPGDVLIIVTFNSGEEQKKVEGLNFNSPKLREQ